MRKLVSRRFLVQWVLPCAVASCALVCWFWVRKPLTVEDVVAGAVRDVNREETPALRLHTRVWKRLPKVFTDMASNFGPTDVGRVRMNAFEDLGSLAPQSDLVVTTLLGVLENRNRSSDDHVVAIQVLERIGPFAKAAVEPLLAIVNRSTNSTSMFPYDLRSACLSALSTIAPMDERWLDAVIKEIQRKSNWSVVFLLQRNAALYDEKVQERLVDLMRTDAELRVGLIHVVGQIQPNSTRTVSILVEYLRDEQARGMVVSLLNQHPIRRVEIVRGLNNLLTGLQVESPPNVFAQRFDRRDPPSPQNYERRRNYDPSKPWSALRCSTISALGRMGAIASESVSVLTGHLNDPDPAVRSKSAITLVRITGDFSAGERVFAEMLGDETAEVRRMAVLELGQISAGCPASVPHLIRALKDKEFKVRQNAIVGLAAAGTNAVAALPDLKSMIDDRSPAIRYDATNAIAKIGGER